MIARRGAVRVASVLSAALLAGGLACGSAHVEPRVDGGWPWDGDEGEADVPAGDPGMPPADAFEDPGAADPGPDADPGLPPADPGIADPGPSDPGLPLADPGIADPGPPDLGTPDPGATDPGPGSPLPGFGALTGDCGVLDDAEWDSSAPFLFRNAIDFGVLAYDPSLLTPGGQEVISDGNLGGSSVESEALAVDVMVRCEGAVLLKTEGEIGYLDAGGKKTDELLSIDGRRVGVSVVRAFIYPLGTAYTAAEADRVLRKKLTDIQSSQRNAVPEDAWSRSVLSVLAFDDAAADLVRTTWDALGADVRGDAVVVVTVTNGQDAFAYP
jgi:hypothetical protein